MTPGHNEAFGFAEIRPILGEMGRKMADEQEELVSIKNDGALLNALSGPLANPYSGMGVAGRDRSVSTQISPAILLGRRELADAYAGDWLCRRVVDSIADDATKSPPELKLGGNEGGLKRANKVIALVSQALADLDVCGVFREAAILERLYGGSAIILGLDDGQEPDQPVNENSLRAVRWLRVLDRWHITGIGVDQSEPDLYMLSVGNGEQRLPDAPDAGTVMIHPTRVLRLNGEYLPSDLRRQNRGWGASVLQRMIASWRAYRTATAASAAMVDGWDLFTHRIAGLSQLIAAGREDDIRKRLEANSLGRSVWKSMLLDESEEVGWINRNVSGVDSILEKLREDVQGATGFDQVT
ncbi:MAG: anti-CBASS protein Acb1 family protein, partial [Arenimonas sp.]|uniref:anti-CBASS protein Acb1 family protein n=1 Tax=Arenimonas sp. TaxID=1872635 RepID=UPI003C02E688